LPTQNEFFNHINLRELIKNTNALILGGSAGSMNLADIVYCPPELEGESLDLTFNRYLKGLGLTNINILPHYNKWGGYVLDGKDYMKDIIYPDSYKKEIVLINDGTYIVCDNGKETIYGEAYLLKDGVLTQICENNKSVELLKDNTFIP
jgi:dipeptidase E